MGNYSITFNGEIYNFKEIKVMLEAEVVNLEHVEILRFYFNYILKKEDLV